MFRFFRKMREALIPENRLGRYFLYAGGEIFLVVVGILIALRVSNWNEEMNLKKEESIMLDKLEAEFYINLDKLLEIKKNNTVVYDCSLELKSLIGQSKAEIAASNVDSLLFFSLLIADFQASHFVLSQLKSTDKLQIISSEKLIELLYDWEKALNSKQEAFTMWNTYFMNSLIPFLDEHASIRNSDAYGDYAWYSPSPLDYDPSAMFQMLQFENRLENHLWCLNAFSEAIDTLVGIAQEVNEEISRDNGKLN